MTLDLLNLKCIGSDTVSRTIAVPSFKSFRSGVFVFFVLLTYSRMYNIIIYSVTHKVVAPLYYIVGSDNEAALAAAAAANNLGLRTMMFTFDRDSRHARRAGGRPPAERRWIGMAR